jgi:hypothetical protein
MKTPYKLLAAITYSLLALAAGAAAQSAAVRYNPADGTLTEPTTLNLTGAVTLTTADLPAGATLDSEIGTAALLDTGSGFGEVIISEATSPVTQQPVVWGAAGGVDQSTFPEFLSNLNDARGVDLLDENTGFTRAQILASDAVIQDELTALAAAITQTDADTVTELNNKTYAAGRALQVADTIDISTLPTLAGDFAFVFTASTGIRISGTDTTIEVNAGDITVTLGATTRTYTATIAGRAEVALTRTGTALSVFVNGVSTGASQVLSGDVNLDTVSTVAAGAIISGMALYNTSLTGTQIAAIATYGVPSWLAQNPVNQWGSLIYSSDFTADGDSFSTSNSAFTFSGNAWNYDADNDSSLIRSVGLVAGQSVRLVITSSGGTVRLTCVQNASVGLFVGNSHIDTFTLTDGETVFEGVVSSGTDGRINIRGMTEGGAFAITAIEVTRLGAVASLPLTEGNGAQHRDLSTNRYDALASLTDGHLAPRDFGNIRVINVDGSADSFPFGDVITLSPYTIITGVIVDNRYIPVDSTVEQNLSYREIHIEVSGGTDIIQRSDGTTHQDLVTITATTQSDFDLTILTQRGGNL